jgi:pyrimidine-nucleoside phosphorylase
MRAVDIIRGKRDGRELTPEEISFLVKGYASGKIPDYQLAAFVMAVFFRGMSPGEVSVLTEEMRYSGSVMELSAIKKRKVDKHSTGGVGDKTSLVLAPAVAAAGVAVPMISGRGLGHTGGTLDKLESIPGFNVRLTPAEFEKALAATGVALAGQTDDLVPADRKLYSLRDVTATIESVPLISASIMSKKLAEGIDGLVLDVKTGSGAFMKATADAEALARTMVGIGKASSKKVVALITDMNQPLGEWVGNSLEVMECLEVLKGRGPADLCTLCEELSAWCLVLGDAAPGMEKAREVYREVIRSGQALDRFREVIRHQGGDPAVVDDYSRFPRAEHNAPIRARSEGFVSRIETEGMGIAMCILGAGRETVDATIDPAVGMQVHRRIGDRVRIGDALATVYYNDQGRFNEASRKLSDAWQISGEAPEPPALIKNVLM